MALLKLRHIISGPRCPFAGERGPAFSRKKDGSGATMLRFRSLSIKLSVSLFRADKIDLFCYFYFSKFSMLCQRLSAKYYM